MEERLRTIGMRVVAVGGVVEAGEVEVVAVGVVGIVGMLAGVAEEGEGLGLGGQ